MNTVSTKKPLSARIAAFLFWSWNIIFLAFMTLGFAPRVLPELFRDVQTRLIPLEFMLYALILTLVPIAAVVIGLTILRGSPARLFALGYVVEGPLMLLLGIRFFVIRQASTGLIVLFLYAVLGMAAFVWITLRPHIETPRSWYSWLKLVGLSLMFVISLYAAIWIAFYALPVLTEFLRWFGRMLRDIPGFWRGLVSQIDSMLKQGILWLPFLGLGMILVLYTASLFVLAPIVVPWLAFRAWWENLRTHLKQHSLYATLGMFAGLGIVTIGLFWIANAQPQSKVFKLLEKKPTTPQEAQSLLKDQEEIREGLLNAYLGRFRYISAVGEVFHIRDIYQSTFDMTRRSASQVQQLYELIARPLLYEPAHPQDPLTSSDNVAFTEDPMEAAQLYQQFFDEPLLQAERSAVVRAVRSTWSGTDAQTAWQAVDDREVHLQEQQINITEHGDWADVELFEVYKNMTESNQEVVYYFNLPESAVITGIWLGNSPDRAQRFDYVVAPRGAAQSVYRQQFVLRIDPALLEQIGPRQYRLRVFPIQPMRLDYTDTGFSRVVVQDSQPLYLWLTYQVVASEDAWALPHLAEKRNVYWDDQTIRTVNGQPMKLSGDAWLPESVPAVGDTTPQAHQVQMDGGQLVSAIPLSAVSIPELPTGLKLAVVLDRSRSMQSHAAEVSQALARLAQVQGAAIDTYLTASPYRGEGPSMVAFSAVSAGNVLYFGGQNPAELLTQFDALRAGRTYDAVIVLTDGSAYELGPAQSKPAASDAPIWMVHLGADIPLGYDDPTLEAIQASGGGVVGSVDETLQRLAFSLNTKAEGYRIGSSDFLDGYVWTVSSSESTAVSTEGANSMPDDPAFSAFAARRLILSEMQRNRGQLDDLTVLDQLQELAKNYSIVTPYSSMLVLVNDAQRLQLDLADSRDNRFDRQYEPVGETLPTNQLPLAGVPEPQEWLLLIVSAFLLVYYAHKKGLLTLPLPKKLL